MSFGEGVLARRFDLGPFNVGEKPQGANGLDIDVLTTDGRRIIGELKTTTPNKGTHFGANQLFNLKKDFAKLQSASADIKYMFVTDRAAYAELHRVFESELVGMTLVCLDEE